MLETEDTMPGAASGGGELVPEDPARLVSLPRSASGFDVKPVLDFLRQDFVVLIEDVDAAEADKLMRRIADRYRLGESLQIQAAFASSLGHRKRVGEYYMSVNERDAYNIVPPHSEGSSFACIQLASFYCYENTTDGGETILMNVDGHDAAWESLREYLLRGQMTRVPTAAEVLKARAMFRLNLLEDRLRDDDQVINEERINADLTLYEVLARPVKSHSCILEEDRHVYWDSICAADHDVLAFMAQLLRAGQLFHEPPDFRNVTQIDWDPVRRSMHSGIDFSHLFTCRITRKLGPREFIIANNFSWTHSVNNWTPGSGIRKVTAAFA